MKNHKGFSLIELVVVISILAIMVGLASYSGSMIFSNKVKQCTGIIQNGLAETRTRSLSTDKGTSLAYLELYKNADGYYMDRGYVSGNVEAAKLHCESTEEIGKLNLTISYRLAGQTADTPLDAQRILFTFERSSGAFQKLQIEDGSGYAQAAAACNRLTVTNGNKTMCITIYPETGKNYVETP